MSTTPKKTTRKAAGAAKGKAPAKKATTKKAAAKPGAMSGTARSQAKRRTSRPKAKSKADAVRVLERETRSLQVVISADEWHAAAEELGAAHAELAQFLEHEKEVKAELKLRRGEVDARIAKVARLVHTRKETRHVECEVRVDMAIGQALTVRTDTGEVLGRRSLTHAERQLELVKDKPRPSQSERAREAVTGTSKVNPYQRGKADRAAAGKDGTAKDPYEGKLDSMRWVAGFHGAADPLDGWDAPLEAMHSAWDDGRHGREVHVSMRKVGKLTKSKPHDLATAAAVERAHADGVAARGHSTANPYEVKPIEGKA